MTRRHRCRRRLSISMKRERGDSPLSLKMFGWKTLDLYGILKGLRIERMAVIAFYIASEVRRRGNFVAERLPHLASASTVSQQTHFSYSNTYIHVAYSIVIHVSHQLSRHNCLVEWKTSSHAANPLPIYIHRNGKKTDEDMNSANNRKHLKRAFFCNPSRNEIIHT